jgi:hypothetical protein
VIDPKLTSSFLAQEQTLRQVEIPQLQHPLSPAISNDETVGFLAGRVA